MSLIDILTTMPEVVAATGTAAVIAVKGTHDKIKKERIITFARNNCGYRVPTERNKQLFDAAKPMYAMKIEPPVEIQHEFYAIYDTINFEHTTIKQNQTKKEPSEILQSHMTQYLSQPNVREYILHS